MKKFSSGELFQRLNSISTILMQNKYRSPLPPLLGIFFSYQNFFGMLEPSRPQTKIPGFGPAGSDVSPVMMNSSTFASIFTRLCRIKMH